MSMDVLRYLKGNPELSSDLDYCIVEKSPALRKNSRRGSERMRDGAVPFMNSQE